MNAIDIILVLLALGAAAVFLVRRWRRSLNPDLPPCCSGCSGCSAGSGPSNGSSPGTDQACPPQDCPGCGHPGH